MDGDCNMGRSTSGLRTHKVNELPATSGNGQEDGASRYGSGKPVKFGVRDCAVNRSEAGKVADGHRRSPMDNPCLQLLPTAQNFPVSKRTDIASVARRLPVQKPAIDAQNKRLDKLALKIFNVFQDTDYKKHLISKKYSLEEVRCALSRTEIRSGGKLDFIANNVLIQCIVGEGSSKRSICKKVKSATANDSAVMGNKPLTGPQAAGVKPEKSLADAGPGQASAVEQQIKIKSSVRRAGEAHAHKYPDYGGARPKPVHGTSPLVDPGVMKPRALDFRQSEKQARPVGKKINVEIIRYGLKGLGIANDKIDKIVNIDLSLMLIGELYTTLEYDVDLTDDEILKVLRYLKGAHQVESWMAARQIAMQRQQEERVREIELKAKAKEKKRKIEKFQYENDFSLARLFSLRSNIADPRFEVLAIGSRIDDTACMTFEKSKTVFADFCHADLNGDIHKTIDEIPSGKKFKEIHFTCVPGYVFNDASANLCLFGKINRILEDGGKLYIKFGCSEHSYTSRSFADSILAPSGFGQFVIPEDRQRSNAVFLSASKVHIVDEISSAEKNESSELTVFNNGATDQQISQIASHLKTMGVVNENVDEIKAIFTRLPISTEIIKGAACGDECYLSDVLLDYTEFQSVNQGGHDPLEFEAEDFAKDRLGMSDNVPHSLLLDITRAKEQGHIEPQLLFPEDLAMKDKTRAVGDKSISGAVYPEPGVMMPGYDRYRANSGINPLIATSSQPAGSAATHTHGEVTLRVGAGIQARNNNCSLAAFFVSLSHNGLLRKLIEDAEQKITMLHASGMPGQVRALTELAETLKTFNVGDDPEKYISNDRLDQIRLRYGLRSATFKCEEMSQALAAEGQVVSFTVDSAFDRGADLSIPNRQAAIALKNISGSGIESAQFEVVSLPDSSLGYMRVNGNNLIPGQQLTHADISGLEFIPLGEVLEPVEFIPPILNEIYGEQSAEPGSGSTVSVKPDMSLIEVQSDRKILRTDSMPSKDFDLLIDDEVIPHDFVLDEHGTIKEPHQFLRNVVGKVTEHYCKNGVLRLKLTKELHHQDQSETRKIFEYFDTRGNTIKKIMIEIERHCQSHTPFIRAKQAEFVNANGQARSVEQRMTGYSADSPNSGVRKIQVMQRAGTYQDLIGIYIDSFRERQQSGASSSSRGILLPDSDGADCPEVLFVTIPNEGKYNRCKLDWRKGLRIPVHGGEVLYKVSAVMAIEGSHYLSWRNDAENGRIHFADSMGDVSRDNVTIPVVVTMPDLDTECALQAAHDDVRGENNHYKNAKDKLKVLGEQVALVILKRLP